uniref:Ig-like domain-containing protein n=1 Tax=Oryzias melastigma TaxID=30732 RepID=A0A3B3BS25_ORYME
MDRRMFFWIVLELVASTCSSAPVSESIAVSVGDSTSVGLGQTVLMPCWLSPPQNADNLEIRWYRGDNFETPVILYMPGKADWVSMDDSFVGRVSFDVKDSTSGGRKTGDGTLKLTNVTIKDEGKYTCYVSSLQEHDSASMNLYVTETGSLPVLSAVWREDNTVNVSCESEGWFPQPELRWSEDPDKDRATFVRDSSGLIRVHSWILVSASSEVSCSVGLPNTKGLTVRLHLEKNIPPPPEESGSSTAGWIAFTILLIIMMVMVIGFMFYRKKVKTSAESNEGKNQGEDQTDEKKSDECIEERRMIFWIVLELVASTCSSASVSENFAVSVGDSKSVRRGDTVLLPCWLSPPQNAEDLVIRWYRGDNYDTLVILYMPRVANWVSMDELFVGRVSFDLKDSTSGGLKKGDMTLKLTNVTIKDEGKYTCYVSSFQEHDSASMNLYVTETGSLPVLSAVWREDNTVNVSCESEGWFPQPEVRWSEDPDKDRATFVRDSSGLIRVHSWILVSASSEVSCSVGLPNTKGLAARLHLEKNIPPPPEDSGFTGGWIAFTILLIMVMVMALLGFVFYRKKVKKSAECKEGK